MSKIRTMRDRYLERKKRELSRKEKELLRNRIKLGDSDVYKLAKQFNCVPVQVAGVKAGMEESQKRRSAARRTKASQDIGGQLDRDANSADREGEFDPKSAKDGRLKTNRAINLRRGQPKFRRKLLRAYNRRCAVTNCDCPEALEAAHIIPYRGEKTNHIQNGILLRSDIHTLFDIGRIGFAPKSHTVIVSKVLTDTAYGKLKGRTLRLPSQCKNRPHEDALREHLKRWGLMSARLK